MLGPESEFSVEVGGLDIAFRRAGAGAGVPLVFVHGALCDSRIWRSQVAELADEFTVVAWDEPGAGRSSDPPEDFELADYADCLAGFIDVLELGPAHIVGLSWGGVLAQELYRRHPGQVGSLVLADTYAGWKGSLPETECAERLASALHDAALPRGGSLPEWPGLLSEEARPELVDEVTSIVSDFRPISLRLVALAVAGCDQRDLLPRIDVPTRLLWGDADVRSPLSIAGQLHDAIHGSRLVRIAGAGHLSNVEQPARFNAEVREFCRAVRL